MGLTCFKGSRVQYAPSIAGSENSAPQDKNYVGDHSDPKNRPDSKQGSPSEPIWQQTNSVDPMGDRRSFINGGCKFDDPIRVALLGVDVDSQMLLIDSRGKTRKTSVVSEYGEMLVRERYAGVRCGSNMIDILIRMLVDGSALETDPVFLEESDVIVVLFDVTDKKQFKLGKRICYEVICSVESTKPMILVGNTSSLARHKRKVKSKHGRHFCQRLYAIYMEIDIMDPLEVDDFHEQLASVAFPRNGIPSNGLFDQGAPMPMPTSSSSSKKRRASIIPEPNSPPISPSWQENDNRDKAITSMQNGKFGYSDTQILKVHSDHPHGGGGAPGFLHETPSIQEDEPYRHVSLQNVAHWAY
eukprot:gb/GECH01001804.1/.p1 GENE.gb/GECH01001804.1/~~gb/GECH01001804.1/.p1  ORF type:complete len:357 (+),score=74.99 gb/GECH01001804.1/:1-1071(+)